MHKSILSVLGNDRPGIIATVARTLMQLDCNIENVSQTILQTEFAGIFIVSMPPDLSLDVLQKDLQNALAAIDLQVHVKPLQQELSGFTATDIEPFVITTKGPDRIGLVARISEVIADYGVNVTNLQAVFKGGDDPGNNIMIYEVDIPTEIDQQAFYRSLREKAAELGLEISIQHRNIFETINRI